jgi:hypothetical protein
VELLQDLNNLSIEGPAAGVYWVKKALQKAGVRELPERLTLLPSFELQLGAKSFKNLDELIHFLKNSA